MVGGGPSQARERCGDVDGVRARAEAPRRRPGAVARARAVLEVPGRGLPIRCDSAVEPRRRQGDRARGHGDRRGRRDRREGLVRASARSGVAGRDEAIVVEPATRQARHRCRDARRARTRACALLGRLRAVARARPVLEVPRRRASVRIDGAVECRGGRRHARRGTGNRDRPGRRGEDSVGASIRSGAVRRHHSVVIGRARRETRERGRHRRVRRARPGTHVRGLRAVARARSVFDVPGRRLAAWIHRPRGGRRCRTDRGDRTGNRRRGGGRCRTSKREPNRGCENREYREICGCCRPSCELSPLKYPLLVKRVLGDWKGSVRARLTADDPRERRRPDHGPFAPRLAGARDRRSVRRRRRRSARNGACEPGRRRPRRTLRPACLHRLARPLPHLVARTETGDARRLRVARRGARAGPRRRDRCAVAGCAATAGATATGVRTSPRPRRRSTRSRARRRRS